MLIFNLKNDYIYNDPSYSSKRIFKFIKRLNKNILFFIDIEYVIFYELDVNTIYGINNNEQKTESYIKYLDPVMVDYLFNISDLNYLFGYEINKTSYYIWYFLHKLSSVNNYGKNFWKDVDVFKTVLFLQKKKKLNISIRILDKILFSITSGIVSKKFKMPKKSDKKSIKIVNVLLKNVFNYLTDHEDKINNKYVICNILHFKGSTTYLYNYYEFLLKSNFEFRDVYTIFTPLIPNKFRYKKIKSLKKNFRKKMFKTF